MRPLFRTIGLSLLLVACAAASGTAEEGQRRRAQPRERAPRASAPATAPAPSAVRQTERATPRSRGTDDQGRVRAPRDYGRAERADGREAPVDRAPAPARAERQRDPEPDRRQPALAGTAPQNAEASAAAGESQDRRRRAEPRGSRPRGDNPAVGRAVPRDGRVSGRDGRRDFPSWGGSRVYTSRGRVYNNYYYYYPRRWYPYGYGAFGGLGYFYYDPYTWYSYDPYWSRPHYYGYGSSRAYGGDYYYDTGELRLQVHPRHAEVYVDGYFAGHVDDFDGTFQSLRLEEGPYKIEIVAPGYETLVFDVRIIPGRKTTYRGELRPRP